MQIIFMLVAFGAFIGLFVHAGQKLFFWLSLTFKGADSRVFGILYGILVTAVLVLFVISRIPGNPVPRVLFLIDHYALGVIIYMMMFVNFADLILLLLKKSGLLAVSLLHGAELLAGALVLVLTVGLSVYGGIHSSRIQTKNYQIDLREAQGKTDSMKIVLISDLHLGYVIDDRHVEKIVKAINEIEPDLVCIAGDIFDGDITSVKNPELIQEMFSEIKASYGVYACLGNHDAGAGYEGMLEFLDKAQIHLLEDEEVLIGQKIILAGRKDSGPIGGQGEKRKALEDMPDAEKYPKIVLDHRPENIEEYGKDTDLILCGHTHQGQMFPFNLVTGAVLKANYGYYRQGQEGPQAIVTSGAGTWGPPMRVGTDNEIVVIQAEIPVSQGD